MNQLETNFSKNLKKHKIECRKHNIKDFPDFICIHKVHIFWVECKQTQKSTFNFIAYLKTKQAKRLISLKGFLLIKLKDMYSLHSYKNNRSYLYKTIPEAIETILIIEGLYGVHTKH